MAEPEQDAETKRVSHNFTEFLNDTAASVFGSRKTRWIAAAFAVVEIYNIAAVPLWLQTEQAREAWGLLEQAQGEADAAKKLATGKANALAADAAAKRAEADAAILKAKAVADHMEAEADKVTAESLAAPELQKAVAAEAAARAKLLLGTASAARDQAKATADKTEAESRLAIAKTQQAKAIAGPSIERKHQEALKDLSGVALYIGLPIPKPLRFDPKNPNG